MRGSGDLDNRGRKVSVTVTAPVTFVAKVVVKVEWTLVLLWSEMAALLIRMSSLGVDEVRVLKAVEIEDGDAMANSNGVNAVRGQLWTGVRGSMAARALAWVRAVRIMWYF